MLLRILNGSWWWYLLLLRPLAASHAEAEQKNQITIFYWYLEFAWPGTMYVHHGSVVRVPPLIDEDLALQLPKVLKEALK